MKSFVKIIRLRNLHLKGINALLNFTRIPDEELKSVQIFRVKNPPLEGREAGHKHLLNIITKGLLIK